MRIISKSRLKRFWELPNHADAEGPLRAWYTHVGNKAICWQSWADVKAAIATASSVGNCTVFNIGGNKYRLIARILFPSQKVFILKVVSHEEYDRDRWKKECGCFEPLPRKAKSPRAKSSNEPKRKPKGR